MNNLRIVSISKFMSKYLRHQPGDLGLVLEPGGWVLVKDLMAGFNKKNFSVTLKEIEEVVEKNDKKRFSFNETRTKIRANQGHSTEVDLQLKETVPPAQLYHGTGESTIHFIFQHGLQKMSRHAVHLSTSLETAIKVGSRKGKVVVLTVDAERMATDGYKFFVSENGVWLTDNVPVNYIIEKRYASEFEI